MFVVYFELRLTAGDVKTSLRVLFLGVGVLLFAFFNAYLLLIGVLDIPELELLTDLFGENLASLIKGALGALYLGIMAWIGSILTGRK